MEETTEVGLDINDPYQCGYPIIWKNSYTYHAFIMTILMLFGIPYAYINYLRNDKIRYIICLSIIIIVIIGSYIIHSFQSERMYVVHSRLSLIVLILFVVQLFMIKNKKYNKLNHYLFIIMGIFLVPCNWEMGLLELVTRNHIKLSDFAHTFVGYGFYIGGAMLILNENNRENIMLYEIILFLFGGLPEYLFERKDHPGYGSGILPATRYDSSAPVWGHITADLAFIISAVLCFLYRQLLAKNPEFRWKIHSYTISVGIFVQGYVLVTHHPMALHREPIPGIHAIGGYMLFIGSILRSISYIQISGIFCFIFGMIFTFSFPKIAGNVYFTIEYIMI